jgi:hypothetical protein
MPIQTLHKLDKLVLAGPVSICALTNQRISAGIEMMMEKPAGHTHDMFAAIMRQRPKTEFSTPQLATILGLIPVSGVALGASTLYLKKAAAIAAVARATAGHKKLVLNSLVAYWTQIRLPHNGKGEIQVVLCAVYDGTNQPYVYTGSVALSGNLTSTEYFGAGPVSINGVAVPGVQEITIQSGIQLYEEGASTEVYDTFVGVETTGVTVTVQTKEMTNWSVLGLNGVALDGTAGLAFYARAFKNQDTRYADSATSHILGQALYGMAIPQDTNGDGSATLTDTLQVHCIANTDSSLPLVFTPAIAIS